MTSWAHRGRAFGSGSHTDVSFIVTPVEAEAHFVRDHDSEVPGDEVERGRARMRREFGVHVV